MDAKNARLDTRKNSNSILLGVAENEHHRLNNHDNMGISSQGKLA